MTNEIIQRTIEDQVMVSKVGNFQSGLFLDTTALQGQRQASLQPSRKVIVSVPITPLQSFLSPLTSTISKLLSEHTALTYYKNLMDFRNPCVSHVSKDPFFRWTTHKWCQTTQSLSHLLKVIQGSLLLVNLTLVL